MATHGTGSVSPPWDVITWDVSSHRFPKGMATQACGQRGPGQARHSAQAQRAHTSRPQGRV
eukprot:scaffold39692_cov58-Phaeocystis_antarctica.AAC.1